LYDGVYVVTGGLLKEPLRTIGKEKVVVPDYFYKILLDNCNGQYKMIAFLLPNKKSKKLLYSFVVSVDSIEKMTGIDFFPKLDDKLENNLEKRTIVICGFLSNPFNPLHEIYHSFTLLASILRNINNKIVNPHSPEPP
jgi:DNA/RNA endonuclease G (NUC1)